MYWARHCLYTNLPNQNPSLFPGIAHLSLYQPIDKAWRRRRERGPTKEAEVHEGKLELETDRLVSSCIPLRSQESVIRISIFSHHKTSSSIDLHRQSGSDVCCHWLRRQYLLENGRLVRKSAAKIRFINIRNAAKMIPLAFLQDAQTD